jgi:hypothetical protein
MAWAGYGPPDVDPLEGDSSGERAMTGDWWFGLDHWGWHLPDLVVGCRPAPAIDQVRRQKVAMYAAV